MVNDNKNIEARVEELEKRVAILEKNCLGGMQLPFKKMEKDLKINFAPNIRAYASKYAVDKSGPQKFVLVLAYLAEGKIDKDIGISEVKVQWNKMSAKNLLGKYNDFYPTQAKTQGWVDSKKRGFYCLTKEWQEAYEQ
jgi:hypothetical protein